LLCALRASYRVEALEVRIAEDTKELGKIDMSSRPHGCYRLDSGELRHCLRFDPELKTEHTVDPGKFFAAILVVPHVAGPVG
jgi:hypothetical protein